MSFLAMLPRISMCCACIDLRTGAIILGIMQTLSAITNTVKEISTDPKYPSLTGYKTQLNETIDEEKLQKISFVVHYLSQSGNALTLLFGALLIVGAIQRNILLLKIYVISNIFECALLASLTFLCMIFVPPLGTFMLIMLGISVYYMFCVNSFLQLLIEKKQQTAYVEVAAKPTMYPVHQQIIITA